MSNPSHAFAEPTAIEAGRQFARLRHGLELAERIAGRQSGSKDAALDEGARVGAAYHGACPIAQRRFDTLAGEIASWAGAGLDALALADDPLNQPCGAAARLADELDRALADVRRLLRL